MIKEEKLIIDKVIDYENFIIEVIGELESTGNLEEDRYKLLEKKDLSKTPRFIEDIEKAVSNVGYRIESEYEEDSHLVYGNNHHYLYKSK